MKKKIIWILVSCLMVLSLVMASCGEAEPEGEVEVGEEEVIVTEEEVEEEVVTEEEGLLPPEVPKYEGIYTIIGGDPSGWDPGYFRLMKSTNHMGEEMIGGDWTKGPAGTGEYSWDAGFGYRTELLTGQLAESWEMPDDETIVYHIRKGIHWWDKPPTNGREMTAEDVAWNINRSFTMPGGYIYPNYTPQGYAPTSIKVLDKYTVEVKVLPEMQGMMFLVIGEYIWHVSPDAVEEYGDIKDWRNFCGTGPYMLMDYITSSSLTYVRNPNYWQYDPLHPENQLPYLDGMKAQIIPDKSSQLAAFRTGKLDYLGNVLWEDAELIMKNYPEIQYITRQESPSFFLSGRVDKPELPFKDVRVRQALNMAINKPELVEEYYKGHADLFAYPYYPTKVMEPIFTPLEEQSQVVQDMFTYHPDKARQLLADAGYPDGFKTQVVCATGHVDFLCLIREYFLDVGVDMEIKPLESGVFNSITMGRTHEEMIYSHENVNLPFRMLTVRKESTWTHTYYEHERTRAAYEAIGRVIGKDDAEVGRILKEIGPFILEQAVCIWPPVGHSYFMWWPWLQNFYGSSGGGGYFTPNQYLCYIWYDTALKKSMGY